MKAYGIIRTFGVVVLLAAASVQCSKIHEGTTDDETANIFGTGSDKMTEYAVPPARHNLYMRSAQKSGNRLTVYGKEINNYLNPSDGQLIGVNTPVWIAYISSNGTVEYSKMEEGYVGKVMSRFSASHPNLFSVVANRRKREDPSFDEIVGGIDLRSLPKRFQKESTSVTEQENIRRLERQIREASQSDNRTDANTVKSSNMEFIYPSLLVQTDLAGSLEPDVLDFDDDIVYQIAFWNGVDLRFRKINEPKIRIRIAGIIIGVDRAATPYLLKDVVGADGLDAMGDYWYKMRRHPDFPLEAYHIVVTMTDSGVLGDRQASSTSSLCEGPWKNSLYSIGIVIDNTAFGGLSSAIFVLASVLGVESDHLLSGECDMSKDSIEMTYANTLGWSPCAVKRFSTLLRKGYLKCFAKPAEFYPPGDEVQRVLPGDFASPDKQCQAQRYNWACQPSPDTCLNLQCYFTNWEVITNGWWCKNGGPAPEGTACGTEYKCLNGLCRCMTEQCLYRSN